MDWITAAVKSEWPLATVALVWLLRDQVRDLLGRLLKAELPGGTVIEFQKRLEKAEDTEAPLLAQVSNEDVAKMLANDPEAQRAVEQAFGPGALASSLGSSSPIPPALPPDYIVIQSWKLIETTLYKIAAKRKLLSSGSGRPNYKEVVDKLELSKLSKDYLYQLQKLRSLAAHSLNSEVTQTEALRYRDLADRMVAYLEIQFLGKSD